MADLYHIFIIPKKGVGRAQIEEKLSLARNWFRYDERCYVLFTTSDENKWQRALLPLVEPDGRLFICKFEGKEHYHGYLRNDFWVWLKDKINNPDQ